MFSKDGQKQQN